MDTGTRRSSPGSLEKQTGSLSEREPLAHLPGLDQQYQRLIEKFTHIGEQRIEAHGGIHKGSQGRPGARPRVRTALISGLPGCGKTFFAIELAKRLVASKAMSENGNGGESKKTYRYVDCSEFFLTDSVGATSGVSHGRQRSLSQILRECRRTNTGVIILDQIESILSRRNNTSGIELLSFLDNPLYTEAAVAHGSTLASSVYSLKNISTPHYHSRPKVDAIYQDPSANTHHLDPLIVIGITSNVGGIIPEAKIPGRFFSNVELAVVDVKQRLEILQYLTKDFPNKNPDDFETLLSSLADSTHGYVSADLVGLVGSIAMGYEHRKLLAHDESNKENIMYITKDDFDIALKESNPSNMLEFITSVPKVVLNRDLLGMQPILDKVKTQILSPFKTRYEDGDLNVDVPKGLLIYGRPGTGKSSLAYGIINELGIPCINVDGSKIKSKVIGESEQNVARIFSQARASEPCAILIDHMDTLVPNRDFVEDGSSSTMRVITTFLVEMDGILSKSSRSLSKGQQRYGNTLVIGITNRVENVDPAVIRPGRMDRWIEMPASPGPLERREIIVGMLTRVRNRLEESSSTDAIQAAVDSTAGLTSGEVAQTVHDAALQAFRAGRALSAQDLLSHAGV